MKKKYIVIVISMNTFQQNPNEQIPKEQTPIPKEQIPPQISPQIVHPVMPTTTNSIVGKTNQVKQIRIRKRDGMLQEVSFDKILWRLRVLSDGLNVDYTRVAQDAIAGLVDKMKSSEIDCLTANLAHTRHSDHPDYDILATRIIISNHHKETIGYELFSQVVWELHQTGQLSDEFYATVQENAAELDSAIDYDRDYLLTYFGFKTFERTYGMRINDKVVERPQHMFMRVAVALWSDDIDRAIETYEWLSMKYFTQASPTNFNAGTKMQQLSSCFLVAMKDDSIDGIFQTLGQCAAISKTGGGLGMHCSNIRSSGEMIKSAGRGGVGLIPMLKGFEWMTQYVDQGRKRPGALAVYLEPYHPDVFDFLELKKNTGPEERRARDLHLAMWLPDLFMKRVKADELWSLMPVVDCPGLQDAYGEEFEQLYTQYEREKKYVRQVPAQELYNAIIVSQLETGEPYISYKDHVNRKSNQKNLGTIKSSNLCNEITLFSDADHTSVCNLASIALPSFVRYMNDITLTEPTNQTSMNQSTMNQTTHSNQNQTSMKQTSMKQTNQVPYFDFKTLIDVVRIVTRNLNRIIDINYYPTEETSNSNLRDRPIGIGIQGLADCYIKMRYPYDSPEAAQLNKEIFETMYFAALSESCEIAKMDGPYESYLSNGGSPISKGIFQFEMWRMCGADVQLSKRLNYDWEHLRGEIKRYGVRNSMLLACMPTASTSQFLGFNESFEAFTSNMYTRRTNSGSFKIINKYMVYDLIEAGLWNDKMRQKIMYYDGSIQAIKEIPLHIRNLYKTAWDLKQKVIIDQSADRSPFICQTQSLNIHIEQPTIAMMSSLHYYTWSLGLKTGMYYLRRKPAKRAIQSTVDIDIERELENETNKLEKTKQTTNETINETINEPNEIVAPASPPTPLGSPQRNETNEELNNETNNESNNETNEGFVCYREEGCLSCGS